MTEPPQMLLREAAEKIDAALACLNARASPCRACGHKAFENFQQAKAHSNLRGIPKKLRIEADYLDHQRTVFTETKQSLRR